MSEAALSPQTRLGINQPEKVSSRKGYKKEGRHVDWTYTSRMNRRLKRRGNPFLSKEGPFWNQTEMYAGRQIIGRDRPINKGVYLNGGGGEAIVVDDEKDSQLNRVYQELLDMFKQAESRGRHYKDDLLGDVWNLAKRVIPYDMDHSDWVVSQLPSPQTKVYLSSFFSGGVCRHQALLAAYLLERLKNEDLVSGTVSVDRNQVTGMGAHAWARYVNSANKIWIIDPAQDFAGELDSVPRGKNRWYYERPEDRNYFPKLAATIRRAIRGI